MPKTLVAIKAAGGITKWVHQPTPPVNRTPTHNLIHTTLRFEMGAVLREHRLTQGTTLRQVCERGYVSLGYLSEIERGKKEVSSELLAMLCDGLGISLATLLRQVAERLDPTELPSIPDTIEGVFDALPERDNA